MISALILLTGLLSNDSGIYIVKGQGVYRIGYTNAGWQEVKVRSTPVVPRAMDRVFCSRDGREYAVLVSNETRSTITYVGDSILKKTNWFGTLKSVEWEAGVPQVVSYEDVSFPGEGETVVRKVIRKGSSLALGPMHLMPSFYEMELTRVSVELERLNLKITGGGFDFSPDPYVPSAHLAVDRKTFRAVVIGREGNRYGMFVFGSSGIAFHAPIPKNVVIRSLEIRGPYVAIASRLGNDKLPLNHDGRVEVMFFNGRSSGPKRFLVRGQLAHVL